MLSRPAVPASPPRREVVAHALRQGVADDVVRVFDEVANELVRKAAVAGDRVPVALLRW
jgi:hypothetical protein